MLGRFHRGGLIRQARTQTRRVFTPIGRALRAANTFLTSRAGQIAVAVCTLLAFAHSPHAAAAGGGLLLVGVTQEFLNSDTYRLLKSLNLVDTNGGLKCQLGVGGLFCKTLTRVDEQFSIAGVGNAADLTDDLAFSKVIPASSLAVNGDELLIEAEIASAANGNNKTAKIFLGATTLLTTGVLTSNNKNIQLRLRIVRTAAATQLWFATVIVDGVATTVTKGTAAENLAAALTLKLTLASPTTGAASDLLAFRWAVDAATLNAA